MIFHVGGKLRDRLLTYAFTHPDEEWHVRQLAALVDGDAGNVSRELRGMEKEKVFCVHPRGNLKLYRLNQQYPLFQEMKSMILKTTGVAGTLQVLIAKHAGISRAFIYGSYAKGKESAGSDVDLVVVGTVEEKEFLSDLHDLEKRLNREINFTHYQEAEFSGKSKETGGFLALVLKEKIIWLKGELHD